MRKKLSPKGKEAIKRIKEKLYEYSEKIEEEYDIMELIEDNIREIFECDLDCGTCSRQEQGECMQTFKKANLYFLRKLYLDEVKLKEFTQDILHMIDLVAETRGVLQKEKDEMLDNKKNKYKDRFEKAREKQKIKERKGYDFYI